ncbi:uncharacterized protein LOC119590451 [Penaeus monodon]|uniref:uncharacterized protein LOC119590451 n=1 Tax=Penaeus monodon TaxID=6687 RepID=UPI0018A7AE51|nr:uncharacterized protein LOC119590451 [Penaeus monodon]
MANICELNCTCHDILETLGKPPCYMCADQECSVAGRRKANQPLQNHLDTGDFRRETSPSTARQRKKTSLITIRLSRNWYTRLGIVLARDVKNRVVIRNILPGTLAEHDGRLQVGDVLVKADEQYLDELEMCQVYEFLRMFGNTISLRVLPVSGVRTIVPKIIDVTRSYRDTLSNQEVQSRAMEKCPEISKYAYVKKNPGYGLKKGLQRKNSHMTHA